MTSRKDGARRALLAALLLAGAASGVLAGTERRAAEATAPGPRIVSINPSLTSILLALGAGGRLVGVDDYSARQQPEVAQLPTVGGLRDTSLEAVAALEPDLVVLVPSVEQGEFRAGLERLGIPELALDPVRFDEVLEAIETLGARVGRGEAARERVGAIRRVRADLERRRQAWPRLRGVLVLTRDPLFVVGAGSFIDEMLEIVGVENLARPVGDLYPRVSLEWLVAAAPDLIVDASASGDDARAFWSRWPSIPAVREDRIVSIPQGVATLPGPHLDRGLEMLARAVRGEAVGATP